MEHNGEKEIMVETKAVSNVHVIHIYADSPSEWNCSQWRCLTPSNSANSRPELGLTMKLVHVSGALDFLSPAIQDLFGKANVIVFQRNVVGEGAFNIIDYWQGMGKPVVIDLDDAYHILPWSNPAHKFWIENEDGKAVELLEEGLRRSSGLLAPNRLLLYDWEYAARGYFLPNLADVDFWTDLPTREEKKKEYGFEDRIVIGWGGSVSHYDSYWGSGIREAAERISKRHPEVMWMICGNDFRIYEQLPVPRSQKHLQVGVPPDEWPKIVKTFDIGVAPIFGPYDQRRSWIKGIEYLLGSVPWVGTKGEPYRDLDSLGRLVDNSVEAWEDSLENIIKNLQREQEIAKERVFVAEQRFLAVNQIPAIRAVFEQIVSDFNSARGRLPGVYHVIPQEENSG